MTLIELLPNLFYSFVNLIIGFISLILKPIDMLILSAFPDLSQLLSHIGALLSLISSGLGWAISFTGLSSTAINLIVLYYTFSITVSLAMYTIKLAVKWYHYLKA